jgi:hypothetical protein
MHQARARTNFGSALVAAAIIRLTSPDGLPPPRPAFHHTDPAGPTSR